MKECGEKPAREVGRNSFEAQGESAASLQEEEGLQEQSPARLAVDWNKTDCATIPPLRPANDAVLRSG